MRTIYRTPLFLLAIVCSVALGACSAAGPSPTTVPEPGGWSLAIHGGAGVISKDMPEEAKAGYFQSLERALAAGRDHLEAGGSALDAVEKVVLMLEDDPRFNAGKGAVFTHEGTHELDAAIMDGRDRSCGAVAGLTTVRNPILVARAVMEESPHVFMVGEGAEAFADGMGDRIERVESSWFDTDHRFEALQRALEAEVEPEEKGTVGAVARDRDGNLAAATSTGGMTNKRFGRVGDVPVIGAGTWADNSTCAVSATGHGEQFIRNTVAVRISTLMAYRDMSLQEAAEEVIHRVLEPGDGGVIAVGADGEIALVFNSPGMFRGAANSAGRFDVAIWED
jgi:beta-aspartyl-peptidase (threonine type)